MEYLPEAIPWVDEDEVTQFQVETGIQLQFQAAFLDDLLDPLSKEEGSKLLRFLGR